MYKLDKVCVCCQHSTCLHVLQVGHATCYNVLVILHFVYTEQVFLTTITYSVTYTGSSNYGNEMSISLMMLLHSRDVLVQLKWNLSVKDTLVKGHLSNEDTVCSPNHIKLCTNLPLN